MPITVAQKEEIQHVIDTLVKATAPRGKRRLAGMFLDLVDRESWPEYYEVCRVLFARYFRSFLFC